MARFDTSFDATSVEPTTPYELLPAGKYRAQIVESEMRVTRNGVGQFLWLMLDILDGQHKGRKIFDQLNLVNPNPTTVEIAQRTHPGLIINGIGKCRPFQGHMSDALVVQQVRDAAQNQLLFKRIDGLPPIEIGQPQRGMLRYRDSAGTNMAVQQIGRARPDGNRLDRGPSCVVQSRKLPVIRLATAADFQKNPLGEFVAGYAKGPVFGLMHCRVPETS